MTYNYGINAEQARLFLLSFALGATVALCWNALSVFRLFFPAGKKISAAEDIIFCLWAGFLNFSFLLSENYGIPRGYILLGEAGGFFLWQESAGKLVFFVAKIIRKILSTVFRFFSPPVLKILLIILNNLQKLKNYCQKTASASEKLLKSSAGKVYNKLCLNKNKGFLLCGRKPSERGLDFENGRDEKAEEGPFAQNRSYCLRNIRPVFADRDPGRDNPKEGGA